MDTNEKAPFSQAHLIGERETARDIHEGGGQSYSSWRSRNTYEFDAEGKARITKRKDFAERHGLTDASDTPGSDSLPGTPIGVDIPSVRGGDHDSPDGTSGDDDPSDSFDIGRYEVDQDEHEHLLELLRLGDPDLYRSYEEARNRYIAAEDKAREAYISSLADKVTAGGGGWMSRLRSKLPWKGSAVEAERREAGEQFAAIQVTVRDWCVGASNWGRGIDLSDEERLESSLEFDTFEVLALEKELLNERRKAGTKKLAFASETAGSVVGLAAAAATGAFLAMLEKASEGNHNLGFLATAGVVGAGVSAAAAKRSRASDKESARLLALREEEARYTVEQRYRYLKENPDELGRVSPVVEAIEDNTELEQRRRATRLGGIAVLGAIAAGRSYGLTGWAEQRFSGWFGQNGTEQQYSNPSTSVVQASPEPNASSITSLSPEIEATPVVGATSVAPVAPQEVATPAGTPAPLSDSVEPQSQPRSIGVAGRMSGTAALDQAAVVAEAGRTVDPSSVEVPEDIANPPRTAVDTPPDIPDTSGNIPIINPQDQIDRSYVGLGDGTGGPDTAEPIIQSNGADDSKVPKVGAIGGVDPSSAEYQMVKDIAAAKEEVVSPAGTSTSSPAKDAFGGVADQVYEIGELKRTIFPGDGFTDVLSREFRLDAAVSSDLFGYLEGRFGTHGILAGVETYPGPGGEPRIQNAGPTSFMPGVREAAIEWLNSNAPRGV